MATILWLLELVERKFVMVQEAVTGTTPCYNTAHAHLLVDVANGHPHGAVAGLWCQIQNKLQTPLIVIRQK